VAQSAEGLYSRVEVERRHLLRDLVLRLVSPGPEGEPVRTRVPRRLVGTDPEHEQLIEMLVAARLVTSDDGALEITHEALTRAWPRLRGWLDDDVEGQRIRHHLSAAADAWEALGRPDSELYRGVRLARALDWRADKGTSLTEVEQQFLEASSHHAEVERQSIVERARAQARMIRRLRIVLGGAAVLLVLALVAGALAVVQSHRANEKAAQTEQLAVSADARRVGARSRLTDDINLSLLLAAAGARLDDSPETRANLVAALAARPMLVRSASPAGGYMELFTVSRDGRWIASSDGQNRLHLYDTSTNRPLRSYDADPSHDTPGWLLTAFSHDSRQLAVILEAQRSTEPVRLLDPNTMKPTRRLNVPGGRPVYGVDVQFSADGRYLAVSLTTVFWPTGGASDTPGFTLVWDLHSASAQAVRVPTGLDGQGVALSPDGQILYTDWPLTAWRVSDGRQLWRRDDVWSFASVDVNAAGTLLALADSRPTLTGRNVLLVSASDGATLHTLPGHQAKIRDLRLSPDGSLLGSRSDDGELIVWDTATGRPLDRWDTSSQWGVGFSPDSDLVYEGGAASMLHTWDRSMQETYLRRTTQVDNVEFAHVDLSPDGQQVAYRWFDDTGGAWVMFVDTATGERTPPTRFSAGETSGSWGTWHPDGGRYAGCSRDPCSAGRVSVLDTATGGPDHEQKVADGDIAALAYVDEGRSLLVVSHERTVVVDSATLRPRGEPFDIQTEFDGPVDNATPLGDGSAVIVRETSADGTSVHWRVIEVSTGALRSEGNLGMTATAAAGSPDGSTVALAGSTGGIVTIDAASGRQQRRSASRGAMVLWLNYSDDGELLVSGADDGGVSLWDATTLDPLGTVYPPHPGDPVPAGAQFIGDSHDVAIASYDGGVYRWRTDRGRALAFACRIAGRDLTDEEWQEFLPDQPYRSVCPGG
jgi:WD40 repeat protein